MFYEFLPANIQNKMICASFCLVFLFRKQKYNNRTQQLVVLKKLYIFVEKILKMSLSKMFSRHRFIVERLRIKPCTSEELENAWERSIENTEGQPLAKRTLQRDIQIIKEVYHIKLLSLTNFLKHTKSQKIMTPIPKTSSRHLMCSELCKITLIFLKLFSLIGDCLRGRSISHPCLGLLKNIVS